MPPKEGTRKLTDSSKGDETVHTPAPPTEKKPEPPPRRGDVPEPAPARPQAPAQRPAQPPAQRPQAPAQAPAPRPQAPPQQAAPPVTVKPPAPAPATAAPQAETAEGVIRAFLAFVPTGPQGEVKTLLEGISTTDLAHIQGGEPAKVAALKAILQATKDARSARPQTYLTEIRGMLKGGAKDMGDIETAIELANDMYK
ncbi:Uncharacterised protein [uncultured archaeon]|nr:Uncharacterised protein [uncultured archaeon]